MNSGPKREHSTGIAAHDVKEAPHGLGVILWKDEHMILESGRSRLAYINGITIAKLVLEGASQVPPSEFARCRGGTGGHVKESVGPVGANPGGFGPDGANVHHSFDDGLMSGPFKLVQDQIEETRKQCESFCFAMTCAPGEE